MSKLHVHVEGINQTVCGKCVRVAGLVDAELVRIRSAISAALWEIEDTVTVAVSDMPDPFPLQASYKAPGPSPVAFSDQAWVLLAVSPVFLVASVSIFDSSFSVRCFLFRNFAWLRYCSVVCLVLFCLLSSRWLPCFQTTLLQYDVEHTVVGQSCRLTVYIVDVNIPVFVLSVFLVCSSTSVCGGETFWHVLWQLYSICV